MLNGKVALITGGATGIGRATALMLAAKGANIVINHYFTEKEALETKQEIESLGAKCLLHEADVSKDNEVRNLVAKTIEEFGRVDILVNSAGITFYVDLADLEGVKEEHWDKIMDINVKGMFFACRAAAPELKKNKGCIVNIASAAGFTGVGSSIPYSASKAVVINLTKSLARALAPEVRVNAVAPGVVDTRWVEGKAEHVAKGLNGTLLERICEANDVAEVVVSLIDSAGMITGQTILIDGGKTM